MWVYTQTHGHMSMRYWCEDTVCQNDVVAHYEYINATSEVPFVGKSG